MRTSVRTYVHTCVCACVCVCVHVYPGHHLLSLINILKQKSIIFIDLEPGFFNRKPARKFVENQSAWHKRKKVQFDQTWSKLIKFGGFRINTQINSEINTEINIFWKRKILMYFENIDFINSRCTGYGVCTCVHSPTFASTFAPPFVPPFAPPFAPRSHVRTPAVLSFRWPYAPPRSIRLNNFKNRPQRPFGFS